MCDECVAFLASDMPVTAFLRTDTYREPMFAEPTVDADGGVNDVNPACGCHIRSKCVGCQVCTSCEGCYCNED
jgi:hypothetical protein